MRTCRSIPNTGMRQDIGKIDDRYAGKELSAMKLLVYGAGVLGCNLA